MGLILLKALIFIAPAVLVLIARWLIPKLHDASEVAKVVLVVSFGTWILGATIVFLSDGVSAGLLLALLGFLGTVVVFPVLVWWSERSETRVTRSDKVQGGDQG